MTTPSPEETVEVLWPTPDKPVREDPTPSQPRRKARKKHSVAEVDGIISRLIETHGFARPGDLAAELGVVSASNLFTKRVRNGKLDRISQGKYRWATGPKPKPKPKPKPATATSSPFHVIPPGTIVQVVGQLQGSDVVVLRGVETGELYGVRTIDGKEIS